MNLRDSVVALMQSDEPRRYVYLSKLKKNMDSLNTHVSEQVDFSKTKVSVYVVQPMGVTQIKPVIDGVFADKASTTSDHIIKFLKLKDGAFITWIDPETMDLV